MASVVFFFSFLFSSGEMKRNQRYSGASLSAWCITNMPSPTEAISCFCVAVSESVCSRGEIRGEIIAGDGHPCTADLNSG